jgi:hypothetical protein
LCLPDRAALLSSLLIVSSLLAACGPPSTASPVREPVAGLSVAVSAFQKNPNVPNWKILHGSMSSGTLDARDERRIVDVLVDKAVPDRVFDATVVDLATIDWIGTVRWVHERNVSARNDRSPGQKSVASSTARLVWLMLAVRANYADDFVDLSGANLRSRMPQVGQSANLINVDFSGTALNGATWRKSKLAKARFSRASVAGVLLCNDCTFARGLHRGSATLVDGTWILR